MTNPIKGRVSVLICTLNRSKFAVRAIRSVLEQTYTDIEVIVSDDASSDDTLDRVREIHDPRLVVFAQPQRLGIVGNPDFGLRQATGEFYLFMGDDDALLPTAIEKLVEPFLQGHSNVSPHDIGATWCPCIVEDAKSDRFWTSDGGPDIEPAASLLVNLFAGKRGPRCSSVLLRTADALAVGGYDAKYGALSDIGNWGRAALRSDFVVCINEPLVRYTMHHASTTSGSSVEEWQRAAAIVLDDLIAAARSRGNGAAEQQLRNARRDFISGITLSILIQTIGKPGWIRNAALQAMRTPGAIFTPYMFRRLLKDGRKVFTLRDRSKKLLSQPR